MNADKSNPEYWADQADEALARARETGDREDWSVADAAVQDYLLVRYPGAEGRAAVAVFVACVVLAAVAVGWALAS